MNNYPPGAANDPRAPYNERPGMETEVTVKTSLIKETVVETSEGHWVHETEIEPDGTRSTREFLRTRCGPERGVSRCPSPGDTDHPRLREDLHATDKGGQPLLCRHLSPSACRRLPRLGRGRKTFVYMLECQ